MNIPKGYKLVPVEPTCSMVLAGLKALGGCMGSCGEASPPDGGDINDAFSAMLDAAPTPPISSPVSWQYRHKFEEGGEIEIGLWQHCEEKIYDLLQGRKNTETRQLYTISTVCSPSPPQPIYDEAKERELFEAFQVDEGGNIDFEDGYYDNVYVQSAWDGWKACAQSRAKAVEVGHE